MACQSAVWSSSKRGICTAFLGAALSLLSACSDRTQEAGPKAASRPLPTGGYSKPAAGAAAMTVVTGPVCMGSGAHDKHASVGFGCQTCHPCGGQLGFPATPITFPGGTTTAGGQIVPGQNGQPTTCMVGCHTPLGAPPQTIAWNMQGPLACTFCHTQIVPPNMNVVSQHPLDFTSAIANRVGCQSCHDTSQHMSGKVIINGGDGGADIACLDCHSRNSTPLSGKTPPLLVGWTTLDGDWHGTRAGTGFGGSLSPPYSRNYPPLPCTACHGPHASGNAFLFAQNVNNKPLPGGLIARAGVGAQNLCESCHAGPRHATCASTCHDHLGLVVGHVADPAPAGAPCLFCHGHEGITTNFPPFDFEASTATHCGHCHGGWYPAITTTPPVIQNGPNLALSGTTATITWDTIGPANNGLATGYVEYGTGALGTIAGDNTMSVHHSVTITGLQDRTTYSFRVRSSDQFRNVALSAIQAFTVGAPPPPAPVHQADLYGVPVQANVTLSWGAVTDPRGETVQYQVQVANTADFSSTVLLSNWILGTSLPATLPTDTTYYWRVMARSSVSQLASQWSSVDSFTVSSAPYCDPYYCY